MDVPIPDFGDIVGLRRLYRAAVERVRRTDIPEAEKRACFVVSVVNNHERRRSHSSTGSTVRPAAATSS
jgi:hypothetical protein